MPLPYTLREGLAGFRRARLATAASVGALAVALVLIGLMALIGVQAQQVVTLLQQRVGEVEVFLQTGTSEAEARALQARLAIHPGVDSTRYISAAEAQRVFEQEFGEGAEAFFNEAFLPTSVRVRIAPRYAHVDSLRDLAATVQGWEGVEEVVFNRDLLVKVQENLRVLSLAGLGLAAIVVLAALFLVSNTIRLTVYARRLLIRTMKLVGATDGFIRRPFVVEGVVAGLVASVLALALLAGVYVALAQYLPLLTLPDELLALAAAGVVLTGIVLGWLGSAFAARRFIRRVALH